MNNRIRAVAAIALTLATLSCSKNTYDPEAEYSSPGQGLCVSLPQGTRTVLDSPLGGVYPLYWSDGDMLSINGSASGKAEINTDRTKARFSLPEGITAPYSVIYPYVNNFSESAYFPIEQNWVKGSFDDNSAPMCSYATELSENITMTPLAGAVKISLLDSEAGGITLKSMKLSADTSFISGAFDVDCKTSVISPTKDAAKEVACILPSGGLKLSETATDFFITLPKGDRGIIRLQIIAVGGSVMNASFDASGAKAINAGVVREFQPIRFKKNGEFDLLDFNAQADILDSENESYLD